MSNGDTPVEPGAGSGDENSILGPGKIKIALVDPNGGAIRQRRVEIITDSETTQCETDNSGVIEIGMTGINTLIVRVAFNSNWYHVANVNFATLSRWNGVDLTLVVPKNP